MLPGRASRSLTGTSYSLEGPWSSISIIWYAVHSERRDIGTDTGTGIAVLGCNYPPVARLAGGAGWHSYRCHEGVHACPYGTSCAQEPRDIVSLLLGFPHAVAHQTISWSLAGRFWDILNDLMTALESAQRNGSRRAAARAGNFTNFQFGTATTLLPGMQPSIFTEQPMQASSSAPSPAYGCGMSSTAPSTLAQPRAWPPVQSSAADAQQYVLMEGTDPDLDAIFAELLPTLPYDDALVAVAQQLFPVNTVFDGSAAQGAGGTLPSPATIAQAYGAYVPGFGVSSGGLRSDLGVRGEDEEYIG